MGLLQSGREVLPHSVPCLWAPHLAHKAWDIPQTPSPIPSGCEHSLAHRSGGLFLRQNPAHCLLQFSISILAAYSQCPGKWGWDFRVWLTVQYGSESHCQAQGSQTLTCLVSTSVPVPGERASKKATGRNRILRNHFPTLPLFSQLLFAKGQELPLCQRALPLVNAPLGGRNCSATHRPKVPPPIPPESSIRSHSS